MKKKIYTEETDITCPRCAAKGIESRLLWVPSEHEYVCEICYLSGYDGYVDKGDILQYALEYLLKSGERG